MSPGAIRELANEMRARYGKASRPEKTRMLDQFCELTGYHRKSANRLLLQNADARPKKAPWTSTSVPRWTIHVGAASALGSGRI